MSIPFATATSEHEALTVMAMGISGFHEEMVCPKDRAIN